MFKFYLNILQTRFVKILVIIYISKALDLYNIQVRVLQTATENENNVTFNISNRQSGIYFIKITSDAGSKVVKIIKE